MFLKNTTVVILGGSSGIGLATAKAAQTEGARVIITGRSAQRLQTAQTALGGTARTVALDVADETGTRSFFQELDHFHHLLITAGALVKDSRLSPDSARVARRAFHKARAQKRKYRSAHPPVVRSVVPVAYRQPCREPHRPPFPRLSVHLLPGCLPPAVWPTQSRAP